MAAEPADDPQDRLRVSLRLKAARHLAGGLNENGSPSALPTRVLAACPILVANNITNNRLQEIEQMKTEAREMELERIARALSLGPDWFSAPLLRPQEAEAEAIERDLADADLPDEQPGNSTGEDERPPAAGGQAS